MNAIVGGLLAALCWGISSFAYARCSGALSTIRLSATLLTVELALIAPFLAAAGFPHLSAEQVVWLTLAGAGHVGGTMLIALAYLRGKVALVTPIVSCEGAFAAVLAVIAGEPLSALLVVALTILTLGIVVTTAAPAAPADERAPAASTAAGIGFALLAATVLGVSLFSTAQASEHLPIAWSVAPSRIMGTLLLPLLLASPQARPAPGALRSIAPWLAACAMLDATGFALFAWGSRENIALTAVLGSQFAAISAALAIVFLRERVSRRQLGGIGLVALGVAIASAVHP